MKRFVCLITAFTIAIQSSAMAFAVAPHDPLFNSSTVETDALGRVEFSGGILPRKETNEYDPASRITSRYEGPATGGATTTFGYDDIGQLTAESATGYSATYTYDANGNRWTKVIGGVTETYTVDDSDKLTSVTYSNGTPTKTYAYHFSGRCTDITQNGVTKTLAWNKENRLTGITGGGLNNSYAYNGLNTRISKSDASGSFTYKRTGAHQTAPVVFDGAANYLPGISEKRAGTSTFLHSGIKNGLLQTDSSQANTATNRYDAFGNSPATTGTWKGPFAYGGKFGYQTDSAELELLGDRYYDPTIGRFLSRDAAQDGRNWYAYCAGDPIGHCDPTGKCEICVGVPDPRNLEIAREALTGVAAVGVVVLTYVASEAKWHSINHTGLHQVPAEFPSVSLASGDKSPEEKAKHEEGIKDAGRAIRELERRLKRPIGNKRRRDLEKELEKLKKNKKGHEKEVGQKWG